MALSDGTKIGDVIRLVRRARNVDLSVIAKRAGISPAFLSQIETGKRLPAQETAMAISVALGLPAHALEAMLTSSLVPEEQIERLRRSIERISDAERELRESLEKP